MASFGAREGIVDLDPAWAFGEFFAEILLVQAIDKS
jgi:hypothetical protein